MIATPPADVTPAALTVCLIEDHARLREQISVLLTDSGMNVVAAVGTVRDGEAAISAYLPDVAVIDQHLPDGSGIDLIRTLAHRSPQVTLLLYSANVTDESTHEAIQAGAAAVILKSIRADGLLEAIRKGLSPAMVTVGLIEDHARLREQISRLLTDSGMKVVAAVGTVRDGEAAITRHRPDVAVIDQHLPDGLGIDLIRTLAQTTPQVTLLLYTAGVSDEITHEALQAGAAAVILKSMRADDLIEAVRNSRPEALS